MLDQRSTENLLAGLNPMQRKAVETTEGPVQIIAGAGSGKTRVLTHRVAYLLAEKRIHPWNILAITFTNKAAREMKERITSLVGSAAEEIWISTFHSMCVRILRRDIDRLGYSRNFTILDTSDQLTVIKQVLKEENLDPKKFEPRSLLNKISQAKNVLLGPERMKMQARTLLEEVAADVYAKYQQKLRTNESLDFDDLLMETVRLFDLNPEVKDYYQRKFQYIHVDEYQDTNHAQYVLVRLLAGHHKNICVVGDSDQSIYRFRGADISNILNFERDYPEATVIKLEQNYRSTKNILAAANHLIAHNTERKPKNLWTENDRGEPICQFEAGTEHEEAYYVAETILKGRRQGNHYRDYAVLYRTNAQSRVVEEVMLKSNIPYTVVGGMKFYERKEIKDILAYLRLIVNPHDDLSLMRVINVPRRGIGAASLEKIERYAREHQLSLFSALLEPEHIGLTKRTLDPISEFVSMIREFHAMIDYLSASEITEEMLERSRYRAELKKENTLEAAGRLENIEEFLSVAQEFEKKNEDKSLVAFLTDLALISDIDALDEEAEKEDGDAVALMTLHSAKGLEFPYVFLIGMEEGIFPHVRSLDDETEMEEERRLAYVGITRAERELHLTRARTRTIYGQTNSYLPSRFLEEIPKELVRAVGGNENVTPLASVQKRSPVRREPNTDFDWMVGDKAKHGKWGIGTVVKVQGEGEDLELNIAFPAPIGVKKLLAKYAPITKA
ncbi:MULTISPECIES: DNA helicase PcrA [unclassified Thermoactinomyces]|jgi:DNA helicase-2/ATP-dependent DNA helicase PcrA|uniref:DNA helicase PcrA n=1 Tax=unclassified Thermoactinomyces TaxID=2634588 RepID=UPI0018DBBF59|nr:MULTISPECIES: DNA helicase PcrA [unclassified Thermoactinomyces]MBH8598517.1 DNA helicase PcrA [Thermoactinomyces sp. CICC 10523]MBH8604639.1 DNA helicase PcrA [Thermoactinomyces sp. CICC 10522]MBH8606901.1 DNA helicase PcrA [Thermoactinomyces sp. CICC 10521]